MKFKMHFKVKGLLTSFVEIVEHENAIDKELRAKLKKQISNLEVDGKPPVITEIFFIEQLVK